ncbi:MAG: phosphoglucosamine mutase [Elusimicrobia bacterium RIFOXYA2_FULL_58_8]|nr:MAG: phosphoglucosamine mutase [Elusimicrobia bacterium RIFOXYA2_FULL_58_8]OGS13099.1 MAG: phosphoglucosamine mutase [Elusimicrobia bacterium RIFOXYA12_FULL_57_11]
MGKLFGTDGIRGVPWGYPFTPEFIRNIGYAASLVLPRCKADATSRTVVLLGMDSRASGKLIKKHLVEGLCASKLRVINLGIIPTPAVAYLVNREKADFGIVISASHNPPEFNGIKFFSSDGLKLSEAIEEKIENLLLGKKPLSFRPAFPHLVKKDFSADYEAFLKNTLPHGFNLKGVKLLLDCANGAAYKIAPRIFRALGATVKIIGDKPDGKNINVDCGALHTDKMAKEAAAWGAFCGISLDGDADRCMFADEAGAALDGDDIISIAAPYLKTHGRLTNNGVALTFMSNYGLLKYLEGLGIRVAQVPVGDKNVTEAMQKEDFKLGGEASGHIIFRQFAPTGDGILTALQTLAAVRDMGQPFSWFRRHWNRYPQVQGSLRVEHKPPLAEVRGFTEKISQFEETLKGSGRIFVRYSGTEPLLRLLVEGKSGPEIQAIADDLLEHYRKHSGAMGVKG